MLNILSKLMKNSCLYSCFEAGNENTMHHSIFNLNAIKYTIVNSMYLLFMGCTNICNFCVIKYLKDNMFPWQHKTLGNDIEMI